jgi:BASS family bile acid:Na+ symporter
VLSVVLTPLAVEVINVLFAEAVHVNPLTVAKVAVGELLLPLGIGLAIGRFFPAARRWAPAMQKASGRLFLVCLIGFTVLSWSRMASIVHGETLSTIAAVAIIAICGLAAGHILGGPDEDDRTVLAFATVSRHPGVAMAIGSLTGEPLAPIGVLLAVVVNEVVVRPYRWWRKRLQRGGPATPRLAERPREVKRRQDGAAEAATRRS